MAHAINIRTNGKAEMAYIGQTPWHGLGQQVTEGASIGVWAHEAGMDWQALDGVPEVHGPINGEADNGYDMVAFSDFKGLYRSDTLAPLSIVSQRYQVVQPRDVLEFFRDLTEGGGWHIHTAGVLHGGRKLWAMASNGQGADILRSRKRGAQRDTINQNLLLATSLDGSMKTTCALTAVRVVCANTLALALQDNGEKVQISHRTQFDAQAIKRALGVSQESFEAFMQSAREMAETPIALDESLEVLRRIFGVFTPAAETSQAWLGDLSAVLKGSKPEAEATKDSHSVYRCLELAQGAGRGADMITAKGTRWGLFNAVTQHVDHEMGRTPDTRLDSAWFGRGNGFKQLALKELTA